MFGRNYFTIKLKNLTDVKKINWIYDIYREIEIKIVTKRKIEIEN